MPGQNMKPKKQVATKSTGGLPRSRKSGTDTSANGSVPDSSNGHGMEVDINTESHAPGTSSRSTSKSKNNNKRKASASGPENVPSLSPPDSDAESDIHLPHSVSSQLKNLKLGGGADQFLGLGPRQDPKERREIRRKYSQLREEAQGLIKRLSFKAYANKTIILQEIKSYPRNKKLSNLYLLFCCPELRIKMQFLYFYKHFYIITRLSIHIVEINVQRLFICIDMYIMYFFIT